MSTQYIRKFSILIIAEFLSSNTLVYTYVSIYTKTQQDHAGTQNTQTYDITVNNSVLFFVNRNLSVFLGATE